MYSVLRALFLVGAAPKFDHAGEPYRCEALLAAGVIRATRPPPGSEAIDSAAEQSEVRFSASSSLPIKKS